MISNQRIFTYFLVLLNYFVIADINLEKEEFYKFTLRSDASFKKSSAYPECCFLKKYLQNWPQDVKMIENEKSNIKIKGSYKKKLQNDELFICKKCFNSCQKTTKILNEIKAGDKSFEFHPFNLSDNENKKESKNSVQITTKNYKSLVLVAKNYSEKIYLVTINKNNSFSKEFYELTKVYNRKRQNKYKISTNKIKVEDVDVSLFLDFIPSTKLILGSSVEEFKTLYGMLTNGRDINIRSFTFDNDPKNNNNISGDFEFSTNCDLNMNFVKELVVEKKGNNFISLCTTILIGIMLIVLVISIKFVYSQNKKYKRDIHTNL